MNKYLEINYAFQNFFVVFLTVIFPGSHTVFVFEAVMLQ